MTSQMEVKKANVRVLKGTQNALQTSELRDRHVVRPWHQTEENKVYVVLPSPSIAVCDEGKLGKFHQQCHETEAKQNEGIQG